MKLAMSNIAWLPEERFKAYNILSDAGISGLEIAAGLFFDAATDYFDPDPVNASIALEEISNAGLVIVSMQSLLFGVGDAELFGSDKRRDAFETGMFRAIELAKRFSIPNLVFGSPKQRYVPKDMMMSDAHGIAAAMFQRLGDKAVEAGTKIVIEANPAAYGTNFLNTLDEASAFVERVDHAGISNILDLGAMHINGDFDTITADIPDLVSSLNHVHISEPNLEPAPASVETLVPILQRLKTHGYEQFVSIEMKRPENGLSGVKQAVDRLTEAVQASRSL